MTKFESYAKPIAPEGLNIFVLYFCFIVLTILYTLDLKNTGNNYIYFTVLFISVPLLMMPLFKDQAFAEEFLKPLEDYHLYPTSADGSIKKTIKEFFASYIVLIMLPFMKIFRYIYPKKTDPDSAPYLIKEFFSYYIYPILGFVLFLAAAIFAAVFSETVLNDTNSVGIYYLGPEKRRTYQVVFSFFVISIIFSFIPESFANAMGDNWHFYMAFIVSVINLIIISKEMKEKNVYKKQMLRWVFIFSVLLLFYSGFKLIYFSSGGKDYRILTLGKLNDEDRLAINTDLYNSRQAIKMILEDESKYFDKDTGYFSAEKAKGKIEVSPDLLITLNNTTKNNFTNQLRVIDFNFIKIYQARMTWERSVAKWIKAEKDEKNSIIDGFFESEDFVDITTTGIKSIDDASRELKSDWVEKRREKQLPSGTKIQKVFNVLSTAVGANIALNAVSSSILETVSLDINKDVKVLFNRFMFVKLVSVFNDVITAYNGLKIYKEGEGFSKITREEDVSKQGKIDLLKREKENLISNKDLIINNLDGEKRNKLLYNSEITRDQEEIKRQEENFDKNPLIKSLNDHKNYLEHNTTELIEEKTNIIKTKISTIISVDKNIEIISKTMVEIDGKITKSNIEIDYLKKGLSKLNRKTGNIIEELKEKIKTELPADASESEKIKRRIEKSRVNTGVDGEGDVIKRKKELGEAINKNEKLTNDMTTEKNNLDILIKLKDKTEEELEQAKIDKQIATEKDDKARQINRQIEDIENSSNYKDLFEPLYNARDKLNETMDKLSSSNRNINKITGQIAEKEGEITEKEEEIKNAEKTGLDLSITRGGRSLFYNIAGKERIVEKEIKAFNTITDIKLDEIKENIIYEWNDSSNRDKINVDGNTIRKANTDINNIKIKINDSYNNLTNKQKNTILTTKNFIENYKYYYKKSPENYSDVDKLVEKFKTIFETYKKVLLFLLRGINETSREEYKDINKNLGSEFSLIEEGFPYDLGNVFDKNDLRELIDEGNFMASGSQEYYNLYRSESMGSKLLTESLSRDIKQSSNDLRDLRKTITNDAPKVIGNIIRNLISGRSGPIPYNNNKSRIDIEFPNNKDFYGIEKSPNNIIIKNSFTVGIRLMLQTFSFIQDYSKDYLEGMLKSNYEGTVHNILKNLIVILFSLSYPNTDNPNADKKKIYHAATERIIETTGLDTGKDVSFCNNSSDVAYCKKLEDFVEMKKIKDINKYSDIFDNFFTQNNKIIRENLDKILNDLNDDNISGYDIRRQFINIINQKNDKNIIGILLIKIIIGLTNINNNTNNFANIYMDYIDHGIKYKDFINKLNIPLDDEIGFLTNMLHRDFKNKINSDEYKDNPEDALRDAIVDNPIINFTGFIN